MFRVEFSTFAQTAFVLERKESESGESRQIRQL